METIFYLILIFFLVGIFFLLKNKNKLLPPSGDQTKPQKKGWFKREKIKYDPKTFPRGSSIRFYTKEEAKNIKNNLVFTTKDKKQQRIVWRNKRGR